jgi:hypothetical protein
MCLYFILSNLCESVIVVYVKSVAPSFSFPCQILLILVTQILY